MTYSHQNINFTTTYDFHKKFNDLTEAVIGTEQAITLLDYKYNRCGFLVRLQFPNNQLKKINAYDSLRKIYEECQTTKENEPIVKGKVSQIYNMLGLMTLELPSFPNFEPSTVAEGLFCKAFMLRKELFESAELDAKDTHEFLLSNIRTGIVHCLVNKSSVTDIDIEAAKEHQKALEAYVKKIEMNNNFHTATSSWENAINSVNSIQTSKQEK
jgi:hypothetical protein